MISETYFPNTIVVKTNLQHRTGSVKPWCDIHIIRPHPDPLQTEDAGGCTAVLLCLVSQQMLLVTELLAAVWIAALVQCPRQYQAISTGV